MPRQKTKHRSRHHKTPHDRRRENDRKYFKQHPEERATACEKCGKVCKLQFHHERYDVPRVGKWLCEDCHMAEHGTKPNLHRRAAKLARRNKYGQFSKKPSEPEVQGG
jgi:hypothetical protein